MILSYFCRMEKTQDLTLSEIKQILPDQVMSSLADDFIISTFDSLVGTKNALYYPSRIDGFAFIYVVKGSLDIESNLKTFCVGPGEGFVYVPGNILMVKSVVHPLKCVFVAVSKSLISELQFDFTKLYEESFSVLENPCIRIDERAKEIGRQYYSLITTILESGMEETKPALKHIFSSMFSFLGAILKERSSSKVCGADGGGRSKRIFESFVKLVTENHTQQKYLDYYADRLGLTPKYLSSVVKQVSGMSAPAWIDSFIVLESKNLLKYTDMDVKEISVKLNFLAPSVFCRFFKKQTGMTPSEYRNS